MAVDGTDRPKSALRYEILLRRPDLSSKSSSDTPQELPNMDVLHGVLDGGARIALVNPEDLAALKAAGLQFEIREEHAIEPVRPELIMNDSAAEAALRSILDSAMN